MKTTIGTKKHHAKQVSSSDSSMLKSSKEMMIDKKHTTSQSTIKKTYPPYSCIILTRTNIDNKIFVEYRHKAKVARETLCCFGGKREVGETSLECIMRECFEELKWMPSNNINNNLNFVCDFHVDNILIARFFHTNEFESVNINKNITFEEGREGLWVDINDDRISPWHQVALNGGWLNKNVKTNYVIKNDEERLSFQKLIQSLPTNDNNNIIKMNN